MIASDGAAGGEILDFVPVLYPPENLRDLVRYVSVLVRLDNGCRVFGVFLGDPAQIHIGTPVVVSRVDEEKKVPFFDIA